MGFYLPCRLFSSFLVFSSFCIYHDIFSGINESWDFDSITSIGNCIFSNLTISSISLHTWITFCNRQTNSERKENSDEFPFVLLYVYTKTLCEKVLHITDIVLRKLNLFVCFLIHKSVTSC